MTKYTKTKRCRVAGARAAKAARAATASDGDASAAMGPLEAEAHRLSVEAARTYRRAMCAAQARRIEQIDKPVVPAPVKGFVGLAALRKRPRDDDDDDVPVAAKNAKVEAVTAVDIAARLMLARQIDRRDGLANAIRCATPVVIVDVPDPAMLERLARLWQDVVLPAAAVCAKIGGSGTLRHGQYDAVHVVAKTPTKVKDVEDTRRSTLDALCLALPVIAFSPRAESHLPAELLLACTDRIAVPPLDARTIVRTIEIVTARACRAPLDDVTVARTGLNEIAIAVRFDRSPADCVAGLRRLADAKAVKRDSRDLTLDELHGMDSAVSWARAAIVDLNSWRRGDLGSWSAVSSKVLLNGPPGTGKTTFAAVFARAAGLPIVTASLAGWQAQGHLGDLLKAMHADFQKARQLAIASSGCVLFIDEVDVFGDRSRVRHDHADYVIEVISGFLELTDGLAGNENLFLIAACNDVGRCDPALVRPGRFNPVIEIGLPTIADLEKMFRVRLGPDLVDADLREVCERALGGAGAEVERIVNDARRLARHDGARSLAMQDLLTIVKGEDDRPEELRRRTAVHEAGHIVLDVLFNGAAGIHATISPSRGVGGRVVRSEMKETAGTYDDYARRIQVLLAGRTAEILVCGNCGHGSGGVAGSDMAIAASMAAAMAGSVGLSGSRPLLFLAQRENTPELLSYPEVRLAANEELTKAADACRALLQRHCGALEAVTEVLLAEGRIDGEGVARLLATANPPGGGAAGGASTTRPGRARGAEAPRIRNSPTRSRETLPTSERRTGPAPGKPS